MMTFILLAVLGADCPPQAPPIDPRLPAGYVPVAITVTKTKTKTLAAAVSPVDGVTLTDPPEGCICTDEGEACVCLAGECECSSCPTTGKMPVPPGQGAASCANGSCQRMRTSTETKVRVKERPAKVGKFKLFKRKARGSGCCP